MIDAAERERIWRELSQWLHFQMCAAQNLPWEEGDNCEDCRAAVDEKILPLLAVCANEALERVRKVSAKWDALADAIDDGSGVTDCAITAARLRAMAKQVDEAAALKAEG